MKKLLPILLFASCHQTQPQQSKTILWSDGVEIRNDTVISGNIVRANGFEYKVSERQRVK